MKSGGFSPAPTLQVVQYTQLDFLPISTSSSQQSLSPSRAQPAPTPAGGKAQDLQGPQPRPSRGSPPPPMVEPYTKTTISDIVDIDEEAVEEWTRANTRLNTKSSIRKEEILSTKLGGKSLDFNGNDIDYTEEEYDNEENEEGEEVFVGNTRMDMRRQKDIARIAGIRCSQL